ncbi:phosphoglycerate mutase [Bordetella ansorpii]|uniref:Phosphoglycerate mutase n=1 Tax=Bordetella ansorpii TaxID=288768 RepID=A0A157S5B7_9BORD|nr:histidine phosphatase family protein [Bordetella ansorpii]SAI65602.1 phosphoglycerate mutase [Bordetella ansorpii]
MTEFWFIRHGETAWNLERRLQGWQDTPLNPLGVNQAALVAERLEAEARQTPFAAIYSSDLRRAHDTALPASQRLGLRVRTEPGLRERGFGVLEGLSYDTLDEQAPEAAAAWKSRDPARVLEGGETLGQFQARILASVNDIAPRHAGERVLAFTHGGVLDIIWRHARGLPLNGPRDTPMLNASINRVSVEDGRWQVIGWGDVAHMDECARDDVV